MANDATDKATPSLEMADEVVAFWKSASEKWFVKDPAFDEEFRERFMDLHMEAAARNLDNWLEKPNGALALILLTDQFPRNAFRSTAHMFATDPLARHFARQALAAGYLDRVDPELAAFLFMPFEHSEDMADQELAVEIANQLGDPWPPYAEEHRDIIHRFGRFPHRNAVLGRVTTDAEAAFLKDGGFSG